MARRDDCDCDTAFGDAVYDAWCNGLDPDRVDRDRVCEDARDGYDRFESSEREVERLRSEDRRRAEESAYEHEAEIQYDRLCEEMDAENNPIPDDQDPTPTPEAKV